MSFLSLTYLIFFPVLLLAYYLLPKKWQPWILLLGSLVFYGLSGWKNLIFLILLALLGYGFGRLIGQALLQSKEASPKGNKAKRHSRLFLALSLGLLVLLLLYGKFGLLLFETIDENTSWDLVSHYLVPLGLSFLVFETISYLVDVYRGSCEEEKNPLMYLLFLSYFPKALMGPLERYASFRKQLDQPHPFVPEEAEKGLFRILIGFFKKIVLAECLSPFITNVLEKYSAQGSLVGLMLLLYSFYLYLDFSGYMDIALGSSQVLGISLSENFKTPYLATSIGDFWRRWHITLGAFFKEDYVYYPLLCSRLGKKLLKQGHPWAKNLAVVLSLLVTWTLMGLWHGSTLNFLIYGLYHGFFLMLEALFENRLRRLFQKKGWSFDNTGLVIFRVLRTFLIVTLGYAFFVTSGLSQSGILLKALFSANNPLTLISGTLTEAGLTPVRLGIFLLGGAFLLVLQGILKPRPEKQLALKADVGRQSLLLVVMLLVVSLSWLLLYQSGDSVSQFVYFQF